MRAVYLVVERVRVLVIEIGEARVRDDGGWWSLLCR